MASCRFEIFVSAYLDGELQGEERELFQRHLQSCDQCRTLVAQWQDMEQALRRQQMRHALRGEGRISKSVRRDLSRSGAFSAARRKSLARRTWERFVVLWPRVAVALVLLLALALVLQSGSAGRGTRAPSGASNGSGPDVADRGMPPLPPLWDVLAEAEGVLATLTERAGKAPGLGRKLRQRVRDARLAERLAYEESRAAADAPHLATLQHVTTLMTLLAHLPDDLADADAQRIADAVTFAKLSGHVSRLRSHVMSWPFEARPSGGLAHGTPPRRGPLLGWGSASTAQQWVGLAPQTRSAEPLADEFADALGSLMAGRVDYARRVLDAVIGSGKGEPSRLIWLRARCGLAAGWLDQVAAPAAGSRQRASLADLRAPWACETLLLSARASLQTGQESIARRRYEQLVAMCPDTRPALWARFEMAAMAESQGQFAEAIESYRRVAADARRAKSNGPDTPPLAADLALRRVAFLESNRSDDWRAMALYVRAERLAASPSSRNDALLELIRLAGLYPEAPLLGDAYALKMSVQLRKGDSDAARETLRSLVELGPRRLVTGPVHESALAAAVWLLQDVDRRVAADADVLPELTAYNDSPDRLSREGGPDAPRWRLAYSASLAGDTPRFVELDVSVGRSAAGHGASHPYLGLDVRVEIASGSDIVVRELGEAVRPMTDALAALERACAAGARPPVGAMQQLQPRDEQQ